MPNLEGSVENIVFRNGDNHYTVAQFATMIAVGFFAMS